jgi:hypothetical protein
MRSRGACPTKAPGVSDVSQAFLRVFLQAGFEEGADFRRCGREVGFLREDCGDGVRDSFAFKEAPARSQFAENDAESPDIGAPVDWFAASLFRTHVTGGAENHARDREYGGGIGRDLGIEGGFGEAEVEHLYRAIEFDFDVAGFEVAVDDTFFVGGFEGVCDLTGDAEGFVEREGAFGFGAFDVFHDEVVGADVE